MGIVVGILEFVFQAELRKESWSELVLPERMLAEHGCYRIGFGRRLHKSAAKWTTAGDKSFPYGLCG
jgi:hypothetical protein